MQVKNWKIIMAILTMNVVLMASGYNMLIPFLPMYLIHELGVQPDQVGFWNGTIFSITFLISGLLAPIWGKLADKKGKKLMAIRSSIMLSISYFAMGMVTCPEQLFAVRAFQGLAAGLMSVFLAMCSALVPPEKLGLSMGIFQAGLVSGTVIGPLIGGTLATYAGMRASFYIAGTFLFLTTVATWFFLPEPNDTPTAAAAAKADDGAKSPEKSAAGSTSTASAPSLIHRPEIQEILALSFFMWMVILIVQPIMTLYVTELTHGDGGVMMISGGIFSIIGICSAITAPFWGKYGQKYGFYKTLAVGLILSSIGSFITSMPETIVGFALANVAFSMVFASVNPSISSAIASQTSPSERGRAYSYCFSAQQFGSMLGPIIGGVYMSYMPLNTIYYINAVILLLLSAAVYYRHHKAWS